MCVCVCVCVCVCMWCVCGVCTGKLTTKPAMSR